MNDSGQLLEELKLEFLRKGIKLEFLQKFLKMTFRVITL